MYGNRFYANLQMSVFATICTTYSLQHYRYMMNLNTACQHIYNNTIVNTNAFLIPSHSKSLPSPASATYEIKQEV